MSLHFIEIIHHLCGFLNHLSPNPILNYELGSVGETIFGFVLTGYHAPHILLTEYI